MRVPSQSGTTTSRPAPDKIPPSWTILHLQLAILPNVRLDHTISMAEFFFPVVEYGFTTEVARCSGSTIPIPIGSSLAIRRTYYRRIITEFIIGILIPHVSCTFVFSNITSLSATVPMHWRKINRGWARDRSPEPSASGHPTESYDPMLNQFCTNSTSLGRGINDVAQR